MAKPVKIVKPLQMFLQTILAPLAFAMIAVIQANVVQAQSYKVLYSFNGTDGASPHSWLIRSGSVFYAVTESGGPKNKGTIFSYNINTNSETVLHSFAGGTSDGGTPVGALVKSGATLYGMTQNGGAYNGDKPFSCGTIFSYNLDTGKETILHSFSNGTDGAMPYNSLIKSGSILYGMTSGGGDTRGNSINSGTIFAYNITTNSETILHSFDRGSRDAPALLPHCSNQVRFDKSLAALGD